MPEETPTNPVAKPGDASNHLTGWEKAFVGILSVACFTFVAAVLVTGPRMPSTILAFFLAFPTGALCYAFLGGVSSSSFGIGAAKFAGTGAVVFGATWLLSQWIGAEADRWDKQSEDGVVSEQRQEIEQLRKALDDSLGKAQPDIILAISNSAPNSRLGANVLRLFREGAGPFRREIQAIELVAVFHQSVRPNTFSYCPAAVDQAGDRPIAFRFNGSGSTEVRQIVLTRGNNLGENICKRLNFTVQLGCDALNQLMPDAIERCDGTGVYWKDPARIQNPPRFQLDAAILNPELVTQDQIGAR